MFVREKTQACGLEIVKIPFGKYCGELIADVAAQDPRYLRWMRDSTDYGTENKNLIEVALYAADRERIETAPEIHLTDHQEKQARKILAALRKGVPVVRLEGGAGYGKSFITKRIAAELRRDGITVRATAVSYVATQVLAEHLDPYGVECATVARTLHFTVEHRKGEQIYLHSMDTPIAAQKLLSPGNALIVDECSMINDRDANLLLKSAHAHGGRLILIGDSHQLPPVKQEHLSQCCIGLDEDRIAELTIPMRYGIDSHLYEIEQAARNNPMNLLFNSHPALLVPSAQLTLVRGIPQMIARYVQYFTEDPTALHRMMFFRRQDVTDVNNQIRMALYGSNAEIVEEDERLMILRTGDTPADVEDPVRYYSGQTFQVLEKQKESYWIKINGTEYCIPFWLVRFDDGNSPVRIIFGVTENKTDVTKRGGPEYQAALIAARQYGLESGEWNHYKTLLNDFVRVTYQYATSVHRAQGQTVDYAYCQPISLLAARGIMGKALAYVALTRARKHLTVL